MATSLSDFKKAFAAYIAQPAEQQKPAVKEGLQSQLKHLEDQKAKLKEDLDKVRERMKAGLIERLKNKPPPEQEQAQKEDRDALKLKLDEINKAFIELSSNRNLTQSSVLEARELLDEMEAMLEDFLAGTGSAKLAKLLTDRLAANEKNAALTAPRKDAPAPGKLDKTLADRKAEPVAPGGTAQRSVAEAVGGRAEAQAWQEAEMEGVMQAQSELKKLDEELKYNKWIAEWKAKLLKDNARLRQEVNAQIQKVQQAKRADIVADKDLIAIDKAVKKSVEWLEQNPPHAEDSSGTLSKRTSHQATVDEAVEDRKDPQRRKDQALQDIKDAKEAIPKAVQAVNDQVDAAALELAEKAKALAQQAQEREKRLAQTEPKRSPLVTTELQVDLSKFRLAPINVEIDLPPAVAPSPAAGDFSVDGDKLFPEHERTANKHGTGRHGAQTGLDLQARRLAATGGATPDEEGNEWGTSQVTGAAELQSIKWHDHVIEWEQTPSGGRKLSAKSIKAIEARAVAVPEKGKGGASSLFLNPEVEQEAVRRALACVNSHVPKSWEQVCKNDGKWEWKPLDRVVLVIGKPERAAGYGYGLVRAETAPKMTLEAANELIEQFRKGTIDPQQLLKLLDVSLAPTDDGKGAKLMPHCKVVCDLVGSKWINTSQFPCEDDAGWDLEGMKLKLAEPPGGTIDGPKCPSA